MEEFLEDRLEILALGTGESAGDIFPDTISWPNRLICPTTKPVCMSHLLYDSYLFHEESGALPGKSCPQSCHAEILARAAAADDVHRRENGAVQFRDVAHMEYIGKLELCHRDGESLDLAGPNRLNARMNRRQWETADAIEQTAHGELFHLATACTAVRVVLTAACAV